MDEFLLTFRQLEKANRQMNSKQTDGQLNGFSTINSDESWNVTRNACSHQQTAKQIHKSSAARYPYTQTDRFPDIIKTKFQPHNQRNRANGIKKMRSIP